MANNSKNKKQTVKKQVGSSNIAIDVTYSTPDKKKNTKRKAVKDTPKKRISKQNVNKNTAHRKPVQKQTNTTQKAYEYIMPVEEVKEVRTKPVKKKYKKRKKQQRSIVPIVFVTAIISFIIYFTAVTVLRAHNVLLVREINRMEYDNMVVDNQNENLKLELVGLKDRNRIVKIAQEKGYVLNDKNIYSINSSSDEEAKEDK